jgi:phosphoenolpyruvate carboxykinase (ATP)
MLGDKMREHKLDCWLVNTGWIGGTYGTGRRIDLSYTRMMVNAVIDGSLNGAATRLHPIFRLEMPVSCPGVPADLLDPRGLWADAGAYDEAAKALAGRFRENFTKFGNVDPAIAAAGPIA